MARGPEPRRDLPRADHQRRRSQDERSACEQRTGQLTAANLSECTAMHRTATIAKREFASYFNGPAAYIVICLFLIMLGMFFWNPFFVFNRASVRSMFDLMSILLIPTAPAMTMGLLAEEKRTGTLEVLLTM